MPSLDTLDFGGCKSQLPFSSRDDLNQHLTLSVNPEITVSQRAFWEGNSDISKAVLFCPEQLKICSDQKRGCEQVLNVVLRVFSLLWLLLFLHSMLLGGVSEEVFPFCMLLKLVYFCTSGLGFVWFFFLLFFFERNPSYSTVTWKKPWVTADWQCNKACGWNWGEMGVDQVVRRVAHWNLYIYVGFLGHHIA